MARSRPALSRTSLARLFYSRSTGIRRASPLTGAGRGHLGRTPGHLQQDQPTCL